MHSSAFWRCSPDGRSKFLKRGSLVIAQGCEVLVDRLGFTYHGLVLFWEINDSFSIDIAPVLTSHYPVPDNSYASFFG